MRLEFEKHTVKTSWARSFAEWLLERVASVIIVAGFALFMTSIVWILTITITQWGKG